MAAITMATGQGPGSPAYVLAQTFQPLVTMAISLQVKALNNMPVEGHGGPDGHHPGHAHYHDSNLDHSRSVGYSPEGAARKRNRMPSTGPPQPRADGREPRRRKMSSRFTEYVNIDDVQ